MDQMRQAAEVAVECVLFPVPGSPFPVPGSWFLVPGSWFLVPGSWFPVPAPGSRLVKSGRRWAGRTPYPVADTGQRLGYSSLVVVDPLPHPAHRAAQYVRGGAVIGAP